MKTTQDDSAAVRSDVPVSPTEPDSQPGPAYEWAAPAGTVPALTTVQRLRV
ncbi:MAG: hypothetical protein AAGC63_03915 [Propionicimonas sp.]